MSDVAKWAILVAGALVLIAAVLSLPFVEFINFDEFGAAISNVISVAGDAFTFGRGLINSFLLPFGRHVFTGLLYWLFGKWMITTAIKIGAWIYHFIFK